MTRRLRANPGRSEGPTPCLPRGRIDVHACPLRVALVPDCVAGRGRLPGRRPRSFPAGRRPGQWFRGRGRWPGGLGNRRPRGLGVGPAARPGIPAARRAPADRSRQAAQAVVAVALAARAALDRRARAALAGPAARMTARRAMRIRVVRRRTSGCRPECRCRMRFPPARAWCTVADDAALAAAVGAAMPGDCLVLADGSYPGFTITARGTVDRPIVVRAANRGKAVMNGNVMMMGAAYVVVEGLALHRHEQRHRPGLRALPHHPLAVPAGRGPGHRDQPSTPASTATSSARRTAATATTSTPPRARSSARSTATTCTTPPAAAPAGTRSRWAAAAPSSTTTTPATSSNTT